MGPTRPAPKAEAPAPKTSQEELLALASGGQTRAAAVSRKLAELSRLHGDEVYARFIHLVSHLDLPAAEAHHHCDAIALHTQDLARRLDRPIDFRVGLTDYFVHLAPRIRGEVLMAVGLMDEICPPSSQFAAYNKITAPREMALFPDFAHEHYPGFMDQAFQFMAGL